MDNTATMILEKYRDGGIPDIDNEAFRTILVQGGQIFINNGVATYGFSDGSEFSTTENGAIGFRYKRSFS